MSDLKNTITDAYLRTIYNHTCSAKYLFYCIFSNAQEDNCPAVDQETSEDTPQQKPM